MSRLSEGLPATATFRDARITVAFATHLFVAVRRRNAWHDTISRQYRGSGDKATVCTTLEDAKEAAEEWRSMGSQFQIDGMTALALQVGNECVIWADPWRKAPFSGWGRGSSRAEVARENLRQGQRVADLLTGLDVGWPKRQERPAVLLMLAARSDVTSADQTTEKKPRWTSVAPGSATVPLGWRRTTIAYDETAIRSLLASFRDQSSDSAEPARPLLRPTVNVRSASAGSFSLLYAEAGATCRVCAAWTAAPIEVRDGRSVVYVCDQDLEAWMLRPSRAALRRKLDELARLAKLTRELDVEVSEMASWLEQKHRELLPELASIRCMDCGQAYASGAVWAMGWGSQASSCEVCFPTRLTLTPLLLMAYGQLSRATRNSQDADLTARQMEWRRSFLSLGTQSS
jgi:hypothetical protein